jgi:hypothetical protein
MKTVRKAEFITSNADEVARILIGSQASAGDLGNVERIIDALPGKEKNPKIQHALADENWPGNEGKKPEDIKEGSSEWFYLDARCCRRHTWSLLVQY